MHGARHAESGTNFCKMFQHSNNQGQLCSDFSMPGTNVSTDVRLLRRTVMTTAARVVIGFVVIQIELVILIGIGID